MALSVYAFGTGGKRKRIFQDIYFSAEETDGVGVLYTSTLCFQLLRSIESDVGFSGLQQNLNILLVYFPTFRLTVRAMVSTETHALVKRDAQPFERLQDIFFRTRYKPVGISIFNTKYKISSMLTRKEIIV